MVAENDFHSPEETLRHPMGTSKGATRRAASKFGFAPRKITMENDGRTVSVL